MPGVNDQTATDVDNETPPAGDTPSKDAPPAGDADKPKDGGDGAPKGASELSAVLDDYGISSADELKDFMESMESFRGKIGDRDLDDLIDNASKLEKLQSAWAQQEREKMKDNETPEETIKRLERELTQEQGNTKKVKQKVTEAEAARTALKGFSDTVSSTIAADEELPKEYRGFVAEFMGVDNPINDADIEDKAKVRKLTKAGIAKLKKFEQTVIKRYRDGKTTVPKVTPGGDSPPNPDENKNKGVKNLKDARRLMHESIKGILNK